MNVLDYVASNSVYTFSEKPFNEIDNLVMSILAYLDWGKIVGKNAVNFSRAAHGYFKKNGSNTAILSKDRRIWERRILLSMMANSVRYRDMKLMNYVNDIDEQQEKRFAAITIEILPKEYYVAFRGTDTLLVSWKEDFNMTYMFPVPSQIEACDYLEKVIRKRGKFRVGGHSKGGNLAVYAAVKNNCDKITHIYNNDGPGFEKAFTETKAYKEAYDKIISFMPESSVIGILLKNEAKIVVVPSDAKELLEQHDGLTWNVEKDAFVRLESFSRNSQFIHDTMNGWYQNLDTEKKMVFINTIYDTMVKMDIHTMEDFNARSGEVFYQLIKSMKNLDKETRSIMLKANLEFVKASGSSFVNLFLIRNITSLLDEVSKKK